MASVKASEANIDDLAVHLPHVDIPGTTAPGEPEVEGDVGEVASYTGEKPVKTAKLRDPPSIYFHHGPDLSDEEMTIVIKGLRGHVPLYAIASMIKCSRNWLAKKIKEDPYLAETFEDAREAYVDNLEFQAKRLIDQGNAAMIMFGLERLGKHRGWGQTDEDENREDDSRLVIGTVSDDLLAEAEAAIAANSKGVPIVEDGKVVSTVGIPSPMQMALEQEREASGIPPAVPPTVIDGPAAPAPQVDVQSVSPAPYGGDAQQPISMEPEFVRGPWDDYDYDG